VRVVIVLLNWSLTWFGKQWLQAVGFTSHSIQIAKFFFMQCSHVSARTECHSKRVRHDLGSWRVGDARRTVWDLPSTLPLSAGFVALPPQRLLDATVALLPVAKVIVVVDGGCDILLGVTVPSISTDSSVLAVPCGPGGQGQKRVGAESVGGLSGCKPEGTAAEHGGCEASHHWLSLDVEIPIHFIGPPSAKQTDAVRVDTRTKQRHRAACACGTNGDIGRGEGGVGVQGQGGAEARGEVRRKDEGPSRGARGTEGVEGGVSGGPLMAQ
jgi:hypothetical protein